MFTFNTARFRSYVSRIDNTGDCLLWTGATQKSGYGVFYTASGNKDNNAHRYTWSLYACQDIPAGYEIDHMCGNPGCQTFAHLQCVPKAVHKQLTKDRKSGVATGLVRHDLSVN